jgi:hypothetical protein
MPLQNNEPGTLTPVWKLFVLRFVAMLSYSMTYIAVPALLYKNAKSPMAAGMALMAEGVVRACLSVLVRQLHGRLGSRKALAIAEGMRLGGGATLLACLWQPNLVLLVLASALYQVGYLSVLLEQELRCGQLGPATLRGQSSYRAAEVLAVFPVLGAAFAFAGFSVPLLPLVVLGGLGALVHFALSMLWLKGNVGHTVVPGNALRGLQFLLKAPDLRRGLLASTLAYSVFALALSAAPFLLKGQTVFGYSMTQQAGLAGFKSAAATFALAVTTVMAYVLRTRLANFLMMLLGIGAPLAVYASQQAASGLAASALLGIAPAFALVVLMAQRSRRQARILWEQQSDVTTAYLAVECLSLSVAGAALASGQIPLLMLGMAGVLSWGLFPRRR